MDFFNKHVVWMMDRAISDFDIGIEDAAAIFGNAGHESGGFKSLQEKKPLVPGSRGGYGIMQWTGPRRRQYEAYCKRNNLDPADMESNYKFLFVELQGPEGKIIPKLRQTVGLDKKTEVFMKGFLRPGIPHLDSRKIWASRALAAYRAAQTQVPEAPKSGTSKGSGESVLSKIISALVDGLLRR